MSHLRLLLGLRYRLLLRQLTSRKSALISTIVLLVVVTPLAVLLGLGAGVLTQSLVARGSWLAVREWMHLLYLGVFAFLTITPVLGFRGSEFYDITKLFPFPVRQRTVFIAMAFGMISSGTVLFFLPVLIFPVLALPGGPGLVLLRLAAIGGYLFVTVSIGQLLVYGLLHVLKSRRFRDLAMVVGPLLGGALYFTSRFISHYGATWFEELAVRRPSRWFRWLPSHWFSSVIGAPTGPSLGDLAVLIFCAVPVLLLVVAVSSRLQERAFLGDVRIRVASAGVRTRRPSLLARLAARVVPADLRAIAGKELTSLRREPMVKTLLVHQSAFFLFPVAVAALGVPGGMGPERLVGYMHFVPLLLLLVEQSLLLNNLGLEGDGLVHLLTTPIARGRVLLGKNLAHLALFGAANVLIVIGVAVGVAALIPDLGWIQALQGASLDVFAGLLALIAVVSLGNLVSPLAPTRLTVKGLRALRQQQSGREGCAVAFMRLLALAAAIVCVAPVGVLLYLPRFVPALGAWFYAVSVPLAIAYVAGAHVGSLRLGAALFRKREERLVDLFSRSVD